MVTKSQFENIRKKYSLSRYEIFFLKYFSIGSISRNAWPVIFIGLFLLLPLLITLFTHNNPKIATWSYMIILVIIGFIAINLWVKRNNRIKSICKDLNISKKDYEELINKYYENAYLDIKDYLASIL